MDSQSTVDHLRDAADEFKNTTLGDLLDTAAEELDNAHDRIAYLKTELGKHESKSVMIWRYMDGKPTVWISDFECIPTKLHECNESVLMIGDVWGD